MVNAPEITHVQKLDFRVGQVMTRQLVTIKPTTTLMELKELMRTRRISGVPVVNGTGDLIGIISLEDLLRAFEQGATNATVGEWMSRSVITVNETDPVDVAAQKFAQTGVGRLPVIDAQGCLVGVLTKGDITRGLLAEVQAETQDEEIARELNIDIKEFYQCYFHIIKNSCDAMPEGGTIYISTKREDKKVKIIFKDNGLGIPDSVKDKIFDPFVSYGKKEGTGLGLSITKKIVEAHNGKIEFESTLGIGTTFVITLPVASIY